MEFRDDIEIERQNLQDKKDLLQEDLKKIENVLEDLEYLDIENSLIEAKTIIEDEIETLQRKINEIENSNEYNEQLKYQRREYRESVKL